MWKRLQGHVREKEKHVHIGNPVLVETTYDQDQLDRTPNVTDVQIAAHQNYVLPPLDSLSLSPKPRTPRASEVPTLASTKRVSAAPTDSSVYSRASIEYYYYSNPTATLRSGYDHLSPPSSPEPETFTSPFDAHPRSRSTRDTSIRDVSPMDDNRKKMHGESRDLGAVPVLRRAPSVVRSGDVPPAPKQKFWEGKLAPNSKVKWDDYSGEPNVAGKAASVDPGTFGRGIPSASIQPMGYHVSVTANNHPEKKSLSFGERLTRFGSKRTLPAPTAVKTPSGEKTLQLPRRIITPSVDSERLNTLAAAVDHASMLRETHPVAAETPGLYMHEDTIKSVVPLKVGKKSPPGSGLTSPISPIGQGLGISSFAYPSTISLLDHKQQSPTLVVNSAPPVLPVRRTPTPPQSTKRPIASDFSWTSYSSYNALSTEQHSPPPSPPLLTSPSVLTRRRPVPHADRIPDSRPAISNMLSPSVASTFSTSSGSSNTTKALPHPPTALCALDHIALLESQQEDLRIRRNNVYRLLSDLNKSVPSNPLLTDFKKAKAVEHKKKAFEVELDEIRREEYDVGLKLHRAWKKREKDDPNAAGSALWVRRVTS